MTSILVIGAGSAGTRHATLLIAAGAQVTVSDPDSERAESIPGARSAAFETLQLEGYDGIVIASPTAEHRRQVEAALETSARILVEKPLASEPFGLAQLVATEGSRLMVGYNLRLYPPVERFIALVHSGRAGQVSAARLWMGWSLPDWRPQTDYRSTYSAREELGGGVLLDGIHELDLCLWLLGPGDLRVIGAVVDRLGVLQIDVEDTVRALLQHEHGAVVSIELDYLSRRYRRGMEVIGSEATIRLDWSRKWIEIDEPKEPTVEWFNESVATSYVRQADRFLEFVRNGVLPPVDGKTGVESVALAHKIRTQAAKAL